MDIAIERYIFLWLIRHPLIYQELYLSHSDDESEDEQYLFSRFMKHFYAYCTRFIDSDIDHPVISILH